MRKILFTACIAVSITSVIVSSCKKEYSCEGCRAVNKPPVAVAGADQVIILPTDSALVNGSASFDPDGTITAWNWTKISGPSSFQIIHVDSASTIIKLLDQGIYQLVLKVSDDKGLSSKDTVQIIVNPVVITNQPPVACAGPDLTVSLPVNSLLLDGSCSTDPDNNITNYLWTKISGPASFSIANMNSAQTQVTNLAAGSYFFELKVTDAGGLFSMDTVQIIVNPATTIPLVDIYVAGMENSKAKYWKNGQAVLLSSTSSAVATSITVNGNDVYVSGQEGDFFTYGNNKAKYWKNGQEVFLTGPVGAGTKSIAVKDNNVYVAGWELSGSGVTAKYWKNGQPFSLTNGITDAEATCIILVGNDVYISGHEDGVAKYWKNGVEVSLTNGSQQAFANSITVVGTDVYVAGSESNGAVHIAKYWKNGQPVILSNGSSYAHAVSIMVTGNNVYVAGYEGGYYNSIAKYWVNGQEVSLTDSLTVAYTSSIAIYGNDVYVSGYDNGPNTFVAKYWKNGQSVPLTGPNGAWATQILVVPN